MRKICFVCTGNTCRSPMAEKLMKKHLQELGINDVEVTSAGISVVAGEKMCDAANNALKKFGIRKSSRKAKQLRPIDLKKDIMVGDGDILDPYGFGQDVYDKTAQILWECTNKLAQNLKQ